MTLVGLAWGSISDWASIALAAATAGASAVAYVLRARNQKLESETDRLRAELETRNLALEEERNLVELTRARASAFDELSDQARLISTRPIRDSDGESTYEVVNDSDAPIFDLEIKLYTGPNDKFVEHRPTLAAHSSHVAIAGGREGATFSCDLRFRDFRGRFWRLDGFGNLTPLEGYVPRVRAVPPGYFDDA